MKKKLLAAAMLCGVLLCACNPESIDDQLGIPEGAILLTTEGFASGDGSKTFVSGRTVQWVDGDQVIINAAPYTITVIGGKAYFDGRRIADGPIYGYTCCGGVLDGSTTNPTVKVPVFYISNYDASGRQVIDLPMVAYSASKGSAIKFQHITAAVNVRVKNEIGGKTLVLDRVDVTSSSYRVSGAATVTLAENTTPSVDIQSDNGISMYKTSTVVFTDAPTIDYNAIRDVQVPILPIGSNGELTIVVHTHDSSNPHIEYNFCHTVEASSINGGSGLPRNVMLTAGCLINTSEGHHAIKYNTLTVPLTFEAKTTGAKVRFRNNGNPNLSSIEYSTDGGANWSAYTNDVYIDITNIGDKVSFRGTNTTYSTAKNRYCFFDCTGDCYAYGNIMSLIDKDNYDTITTLTASRTFYRLFSRCRDKVYNNPTKSLALPATTLTDSCYEEMFANCSSLTYSPILYAPVLVKNCYKKMFYSCTCLNDVTCLATNISATDCTNLWLDNVAPQGLFTVAALMSSWGMGASGVPYGWIGSDYPAQ